jgi:hypothetical protein
MVRHSIGCLDLECSRLLARLLGQGRPERNDGTGGSSAGTTAGGKGGGTAGSTNPIGGAGGEAGARHCDPDEWATCCVREYDLASYTGSREGLCPASQVTHCGCDEGQATVVVCAPDASACVVQNGVCEPEVDCGWYSCDGTFPHEPPSEDFCESMSDQIETASEGIRPRRCVRDSDCASPELCIRRIYNVMFCADPASLGNGGGAGAP